MAASTTLQSVIRDEVGELTNDLQEKRMHAFEQVEACLMQNVVTKEHMNFNAVQIVKQLIRWFGITPTAIPERVLSLLLEVMRSDYGDEVVRKIPLQRFKAELRKIRHKLRDLPTKRCMELLDNIQDHIDVMYNNSVDAELTIEGFDLNVEDFEAAWGRASVDDIATMASIAEALNVECDEQLQQELIKLQVKLCDYPIEYLLQTPNMFLHLLHMQQHLPQTSQTMFQINRTLSTIVKMMQHGLAKRNQIVHYAKSIEAGACADARPQLRISSALSLMLIGCVDQLKHPELMNCDANWHPIELISDIIKTYTQIGEPIPEHIVLGIGAIVPNIITYCKHIGVPTATDTDFLEKQLMIPRLQSLIFNGLLMDALKLNETTVDHATARELLHPLAQDTTYLCCVMKRVNDFIKLYKRFFLKKPDEYAQMQMINLQDAYKMAMCQLRAEPKMIELELLENQREISYVIIQLGSKALLEQLCAALVKCTCLFTTRPELRVKAEILLLTLFDMPDKELSKHALRLLKQPVVDHFHAFMNKTNYMPSCSNMQLARQHILGLPISCHLLRKILIAGWRDMESTESSPLQDWCIDYLTMVLGLFKLIPAKDFATVFEMVMPVLPLIVCRAINKPQLQMLLWELFEPDEQYVEPLQALVGNVCYLFHPDKQKRTDAMARVAFIVIAEDREQKYKPEKNKLSMDLLCHDLCVIQPPMEYNNIFCNRDNPPPAKAIPVLLRLLDTPDLRPAVRKSTLTQITILMNNWEAAKTYTNCPSAYVLCVKTIQDLLRRTSPDDVDTLLPALSILLRVLLCNEHFRRLCKESIAELLNGLMRCLFLLPHSEQMRAEASTCIFLLLFHEHITAKEFGLELDVDVSAMSVPITYELNHSVPHSIAYNGLTMQKELLDQFFKGDADLHAHHWRLFIAHAYCGSVDNLSLSAMRELDIKESLKLRPSDLALVYASQIPRQLRNQLVEATNCSSHEALQQLVASIQLFLVYMGASVEEEQGNAIWLLLHKYLRLVPSNDADRNLYTDLLQLCASCLQLKLPQIVKGLYNALSTDPDHSFFLVLNDNDVSMEMMQLVTECLTLLVIASRSLPKDDTKDNNTVNTKLFIDLSALARKHFDQRNLQHVRCLLRLVQVLSMQPLDLNEDSARSYCQHFVQLSSSLRTNTYTGSQLLKDCLMILVHLQSNFSLNIGDTDRIESGMKVLRYLFGLCGHVDAEVRSLAWVTVSSWCKNSDDNMLGALLDVHDFSPNGLPECCLITFLDGNEKTIVRELAGRLFELLMCLRDAESIYNLLQRHSFFNEAHLALGEMHVPLNIALDADRSSAKHSCEIIACFVAICARLISIDEKYCVTLCELPFVHALSNVIKMPKTAMTSHMAYLGLCAEDIFRFYILCYKHNIQFMQRHIFRDTVLLDGYCTLMDMILDQPNPLSEHTLVEVIKMLVIFCKDEGAYKYLCNKLIMQPNMLFHLLDYGLSFDFIRSVVQEYTMQALSLMLAKASNKSEGFNILNIFEAYVDESSDEEEKPAPDDKAEENPLEKQFKRMCLKPSPNQMKTKKSKARANPEPALEINTKKTGIFHLYHRLDRLFEMNYPDGKYNFLVAPQTSHVNVCEVIGNLLRQASCANTLAAEYQLLQRIFVLLETFLDDPSVGNANAYVRRVGAHKTREIINNLLVLLNMLINWHSVAHANVSEQVNAARFVRLLLRMWPWLSHSLILKNLVVRLTMLLTEHSVEMCKQASLLHSGHPKSLLSLIVHIAECETTKKETTPPPPPATNAYSMEASLRVMINCSAVVEGRLGMAKLRVLDMFDTVLPANPNMAKVKDEVQLAWLAFWDIYSRYEQGSKLCHFVSLMNGIRRSPPLSPMRLRCLYILRNMCFDSVNRTQLVNTNEFMDLLRDVVSQPVQDGSGAGEAAIDTYKEHHVVVVCLWQLFGYNAKCRAMLRGTKLHKRLKMLDQHLDALLDARGGAEFDKIPFASELKEVLHNLFNALE